MSKKIYLSVLLFIFLQAQAGCVEVNVPGKDPSSPNSGSSDSGADSGADDQNPDPDAGNPADGGSGGGEGSDAPDPDAGLDPEEPKVEVLKRLARQHVDQDNNGMTLAACESAGFFCEPSHYIVDQHSQLKTGADARVLKHIVVKHLDVPTDVRFKNSIFVYDVCLTMVRTGLQATVVTDREILCFAVRKASGDANLPIYGANGTVEFPGDGLLIPADSEINIGMQGSLIPASGATSGAEWDAHRRDLIGDPAGSFPNNRLKSVGSIQVDLTFMPFEPEQKVYQMMRVPFIDTFFNGPHLESVTTWHTMNAAGARDVGGIYGYMTSTPAYASWKVILQLQAQLGGPVANELETVQTRQAGGSYVTGDKPWMPDFSLQPGERLNVKCRIDAPLLPFTDCAFFVAVEVLAGKVQRPAESISSIDRQAYCNFIKEQAGTTGEWYTHIAADNDAAACVKLLSE